MSSSRIVVVGGGLVGCAAALGLARQGFAVTLIEPRPPVARAGRLGVDIRNVALNPQSRELLESLGVWSADHAAPYTRMEVWEQWGTGHQDFAATDAGVDYLGWLVEMSPLHLALWAAVDAAPAIEVMAASIRDVSVAAGSVRVSTERGSVDACLLLAADGGNSPVRRALEVPVAEQALDQVALATVVRTAQPHGAIARQRFLVEGPLALLPLQDGRSSVVWSDAPERVAEALAVDEQELGARLVEEYQANPQDHCYTCHR